MMKQHKKLIIVTMLITLLPMLAGIVLWKELPDVVATHFNAQNEPNGWSSKGMAVFGIPAILTALHLFCVLMAGKDPRRQNISVKMQRLVLWICPLCSFICGITIYGYALGAEIDFMRVVNLFIGFLFIGIGNYLPKSRQNGTVGIRLSWTLSNEENWNKTHRLAGWLWVLCGIVILFNVFLGQELLLLAAVFVACIIPTVYSYMLHRKGI